MIDKIAALAKAKARRGVKMVTEREFTIVCPRHADGEVDVEVSYGIDLDGWALKDVPTGCDVGEHELTPDERAELTERIDRAYQNFLTSQEQSSSNGEGVTSAQAGGRWF